MDVAVRQGPAFAVARLTLAPNERVKAESGAMMATIPSVSIEAKADGGVLKSLKRAALGGESFFVTSYTASGEGGWVDVAAYLPGDISVVNVGDTGWFVQKGSWIASADGVNLDTKWGGFKNLFGSEGGFILRADGLGPMVISGYGAIEVWELGPGEQVTLDTGHMVAYEETVQMALRKATGGLVQTFKSGEGLVFDFTGPGKLLVQTRNPNEFLSFIGSTLGTGNSGGGGTGNAGVDAVLGGLFGRD